MQKRTTREESERLSKRRAARILLEGILLLMVGAYFFYRSWKAFILLAPLLFPYYRYRQRQDMEKRKENLTLEFREAIAAVCVSMQAGYSAENAFKHALEEMKELFGETGDICLELKQIQQAVNNNVPLEQVLAECAERNGVAEMEDFAQVFLLGKRSGGDMNKIIQSTVSLISEKIEVKREIHTILSAKQMELKIMSIVPFGILLYIELASPGFFQVLYHNSMGICVMSGCLLLYLGAQLLGRKILDISV